METVLDQQEIHLLSFYFLHVEVITLILMPNSRLFNESFMLKHLGFLIEIKLVNHF